MLPKKILFCADFSENSESARRLALEYAKAFGSSLTVLHVFTVDFSAHPSINEDSMSLAWVEERAPYELTLKNAEDKANKALDALAEECRSVINDVKVCRRKGHPVKEILRCAEEESADLIIMGTHGWTGLSRLLLGSTAENVIRASTLPVLIVRPPKVKTADPNESYWPPVP